MSGGHGAPLTTAELPLSLLLQKPLDARVFVFTDHATGRRTAVELTVAVDRRLDDTYVRSVGRRRMIVRVVQPTGRRECRAG